MPIPRLLAEAAVMEGAKVKIVKLPTIFWVEKGRKRWLFYGAFTPLNRLAAGKVADNKKLTKSAWKQEKLPVAQDVVLNKRNFNERFKAVKWHFPVVLKPMAGTIKGRDVVTNIRTEKGLKTVAKRMFRKGHADILVEEYYDKLVDYRVVVLKNEVIAVAERTPPLVLGDGKKTIFELIGEKNEQRSGAKEIGLGEIKIDDELKNNLANQGLKPDAVLAKNRKVRLKNVCNLGGGGEVADATDEICAHNKNLAIRAARALDLDFVGLDLLCKDIAKPLRKGGGILLEANERPDIALHHFPQKGKPRPVAREVLRALLKEKR